MDDSKLKRANGHDYTGAVVEHLRLSGAHVARVMHPPGQHIETHAHDWPVLTLYRLGGYREQAEDGRSIVFDGPSVVLQPAGVGHADEIGERGLETLAMTFDPAWLTPEARALMPARTQWRQGGDIAIAARALAEAWAAAETGAEQMRALTSQFVIRMLARAGASRAAPAWAGAVTALLDCTDTTEMARSLSLHPAWLARAYRAWRGEGLAETARRLRVERAALLLRGSDAPLADIALAAGFCDQSHMNRAFRAVLDRTPLDVRLETALLQPLAT